jgi:hypothetical protein
LVKKEKEMKKKINFEMARKAISKCCKEEASMDVFNLSVCSKCKKICDVILLTLKEDKIVSF